MKKTAFVLLSIAVSLLFLAASCSFGTTGNDETTTSGTSDDPNAGYELRKNVQDNFPTGGGGETEEERRRRLGY